MAFESLILDARGNPYQGTLDTIGGETITDARVSFATLGALNAEIIMDIQGKASARFDIRTAAMNATLVFEGTLDGANYYSLPAFDESTEAMITAVIITSTAGATYVIGCVGWRRVRCRVSAYTSGNCVVTPRATIATHDILVRQVTANLHVTGTAAANTSATVSLAAGGAGLFHFITNMHLIRSSTAALAGTAILIHTSTNLPGNPAWSAGNAIAAGGTQLDLEYAPATPLKSLLANTPTTIVMPAAGAAVVNRINVSYYVGA